MPGSIGPKWFGLRPPYNLGSVHITISDTWIKICSTIYSNSYKYWLQTTSISVFIERFSSLITKHNWHRNRYNHGHRRQKWPPSAPHEALRSTPMLWMNRLQPPPASGCNFGGGWGCLWPSKHSFVPAIMNHHNIGVFWGPYTPLTAHKIISAWLGGCRLSIRCAGAERKASCGAIGGRFRRRWSLSAMIVLVDVGCWRLTSDQPT